MQRNRERGVPDEMLKGKEKELVEGAGGLAAASAENQFHSALASPSGRRSKLRGRKSISGSGEQAAHYNVSVDKMRKQLEEHDGLNALAEQILLGKTLDFLKSNVSVEPAARTAGCG